MQYIPASFGIHFQRVFLPPIAANQSAIHLIGFFDFIFGIWLVF